MKQKFVGTFNVLNIKCTDKFSQTTYPQIYNSIDLYLLNDINLSPKCTLDTKIEQSEITKVRSDGIQF